MNDENEPNLDSIFAPENADAINQKFYENPAAVLKGVATAALREGQRMSQAERQSEAVAASHEANWSQFWAANKDISRADRPEVRRHLMELINGADSALASYQGDPSGAYDLMAERASAHLRSLAKQRAEDAENSVFSGSLEEGSGEGAFEQGTSLTSIVRQRREAKRGRGRTA